MRRIVFKTRLKVTGIFVIILSQDGFESNYPKIKSYKQLLSKVSLRKEMSKSPLRNSGQLFPIK